MREMLRALNRPKEAFKSGNTTLTVILVLLTVLVNSVLDPILEYFFGKFGCELDALQMLRLTALGLASYLAICAVIWLLCRCFGSRASLKEHIQTWGMSFFPTLLCALVVGVTETFFYVFWNSIAWGVAFNVLFGGILLWKTVLYVIYLREVAQLRGGRLLGAMVVICVFIVFLAWADTRLGLKSPVI